MLPPFSELAASFKGGGDIRAYNWFAGKSKSVPDYVIRIKICERMGWDWWTYRRQPVTFIQELLRTWESESAVQKDK